MVADRQPDRRKGLRRVFSCFAVIIVGFGYTSSQPGLGLERTKDYAAQPLFVAPHGLATLVRWDVLFGLPALYVACVMVASRVFLANPKLRVVKASVKDGESLNLYNYVVIAYNVVQIAVCGWMVWGLAPVLTAGKLPWFGLGLEYSAEIEKFVFVHFLTKMLDWFDTLFMLVEGKEVSFLHVFHHATIGVVWGYLLSIGHGNGTAAYGAWINSVTHVIMYTHYLVTALGFNNPLKAQVTQFQLAQFMSCIVHALLVLTREDAGCPHVFGLFQISYHITMLLLFGWNMKWFPAWLTGYKKKKLSSMEKRLL
jgi:elongation of very long chain fatty acids protein 4